MTNRFIGQEQIGIISIKILPSRRKDSFLALVRPKIPEFKRPGGDNKWKPVSSHCIVQETKCVDVKTGRIAQAVLTKQWQSVTVATGFVKPTPRLKPRPAPAGVIRFQQTVTLENRESFSCYVCIQSIIVFSHVVCHHVLPGCSV